MGKRRRNDDYLTKKMLKLMKRMEKRKKRRRYSDSDNSSDSEMAASPGESKETTNEEPPHWRTYDYDVGQSSRSDTPEAGLSSVVQIPAPTPTPPRAPTPQPQQTPPHKPDDDDPEPLDEETLDLLGPLPQRDEGLGPNIHRHIASRWTDVLINGLNKEGEKEILAQLPIFPGNLTLAKAPLINAEVKAAVQDNIHKRDVILKEKQDILGSIISALATEMSNIIKSPTGTSHDKTLKTLSDTGRLLCQLHHNETVTRRAFLLACVNKDVKEHLKELKRDQFLFSGDLGDRLRSMKVISKTGAEMKPAVPNKNKSTGPRPALNWRGPPPSQLPPPPPPPPPPPHRRAYRPNTSSGATRGRSSRQQPSRRRTTRPYKQPRH